MWIIERLAPANYSRFIDVFGGSGTVLMNRPIKRGCMEVYNDYNSNLTNLFFCVKERPLALITELGFLPLNSRDDYDAISRQLKCEEFDDEYLAIELELADKYFSPLHAKAIKALLLKRAQRGNVRRAAGLILSVCALLIYRRRDMERAGDVVAVPVLKPIFKYCMTFGCALVLAVSPSYIGTGTINASGMTAALTELALLLAGAFVGYFAAEMLMQKTLRVFRGHWCGFIVSGVIIIALTMLAELDLTGYERRTPAAGDVEWVHISNYSDDGRLSTPENIAALVDFHREIIANKPVNEAADDHNGLIFEYRLKNGKIMTRAYNIAADAIDMADPYSNIRRLGDVMNLQEAVDYRIDFANGRAVTPENVEYASIDGGYTDENGEWQTISLRLTPEQAAEFYNECVVPDSKDSHLGHVWPVRDDEYFDTMSYLGLQLELRREIGASPNVVYDSNIDYVRTDYTYINLTVDAARCVKWLEENSDIRLMTLREADPESAEEQLQWNTVTMAQVPTRDSSVGIIGGADGPTAIFIS